MIKGLVVVFGFYAPVFLIGWTARTQVFEKREWVALLFSGCWLAASLPFVTEVGEKLGFWTFECQLMEKVSIMAIWIAWWLALSLLPILFNNRGYRYYHSVSLMVAAYVLDLLIMPFLGSMIKLHANWQWADIAVCLCLYTSLQITRTTIRKTAFYKRNLFLGFTLIIAIFWMPPAVIFGNALFFLDLDWWSLPTIGMLVGFSLAHQAAWGFARKGKGTPFPLDPPQHLVTSGAYRVVRNPMQTGFLIASISWALMVGLWAMAVLPLSLLVYSIGFCNKGEEAELSQRFGDKYLAYKRKVRYWFLIT